MRRCAVAMIGLLVCLPGCSRSVWEAGYAGVRAPSGGKVSPAIDVRRVGWERIDTTLRELDRQMAASIIPVNDWTPEQKAEAHAMLLRALEIPSDPRRVEVLGRSDFATTGNPSPLNDKERDKLEAFAIKVGADTVVWSSHELGLTEGPGTAYIAFFLRYTR